LNDNQKCHMCYNLRANVWQYFIMCGDAYVKVKNLWPYSVENVMISWICSASHKNLINKIIKKIQCKKLLNSSMKFNADI
jgi:hypothetical protein